MATLVAWMLKLCGVLFIFRILLVLLKGIDFARFINGRVSSVINWCVDVSSRRSMPSINILPDDCLLEVMVYLRPADLLRCGRVCRRWRHLVDTPTLWGQADFVSAGDARPWRRPLNKQYKAYVQFLLKKKPRIKSMIFEAERKYLDEDSFSAMAELLSSGICANISSVAIKWCNQSDANCDNFEHSFILFMSILCLFHEFCPKLQTMKIQFNWTLDSVDYLGKLSHLRELDISCIPRIHCIQKWHIDKILTDLTNLQRLKILVTFLHKTVQRFSFKSRSLEVLDISSCANFLIAEMDLPKLKIFTAKNIRFHHKCARIHRVCLFDVISVGCPSLIQIGNLCSSEPGLENFELNNKAKLLLRMCFCSKHMVSLKRPGQSSWSST